MSIPELADPEVVAEIVAPTRDIETPVGEPLVELDKVTVMFGGLTALDSVTFTINRGEILGLIGPNGAGKTTCFNAMTGVYRPTSGHRHVRPPGDGQAQAQPDHSARHRPNLPERPAVRRDDGSGERGGRHRCPAPDLRSGRHIPNPAAPSRGTRRHRSRHGAAGIRRRRRPRHGKGAQPALRRPAAAGDRPGAGHRTEAALPGRAAAGFNPTEKAALWG